MARAPKLRRRAKGVAGLLLAEGPGSSSKGLSSTEPEFALEMLSVRGRAWKGELWFGEPDRPMVVSDRRRRWALTAAVVMGPGYGWAWPGAEPWPKMSRKVWPVTEARRRSEAPGLGSGGELRPEDMVESERASKGRWEGGCECSMRCVVCGVC